MRLAVSAARGVAAARAEHPRAPRADSDGPVVARGGGKGRVPLGTSAFRGLVARRKSALGCQPTVRRAWGSYPACGARLR